MQIDFTDQEIKAMQMMIHFACQHKGLEVAEAAAVLNNKLRSASGPTQKDITGTGTEASQS